jgi:uncharacterized protein YbaP (TraB family)
VLNFIKSTDESNVSSIVETARKLWKKNIEIAKRNAETLTRQYTESKEELLEFLSEAEVEYKESFLNIDPSKKSKVERENYVNGEYQQQIANALGKVDSLKKQLKELEDKYERATKINQGNMDLYIKYLSEIS